MLSVTLLFTLIVALLIPLSDMLLVTWVATLPVRLLFTWLSAPMSRSAVPVRTIRKENRRKKDFILCTPLCKEIDSRKGCITTMGAAGLMNVLL